MDSKATSPKAEVEGTHNRDLSNRSTLLADPVLPSAAKFDGVDGASFVPTAEEVASLQN